MYGVPPRGLLIGERQGEIQLPQKVGLKDATATVASFALLCGACNIYLHVLRSIVRGGTKLF